MWPLRTLLVLVVAPAAALQETAEEVVSGSGVNGAGMQEGPVEGAATGAVNSPSRTYLASRRSFCEADVSESG